MMSREITREQFEQVLKDAAYLQDEADALTYVIDTVAYTEKPPDGESVSYKLLLLNNLQNYYFRPVFEKILGNKGRGVKTGAVSVFIDDFQSEDEEHVDIQKILSRVSKNRASLLNIFKKIPLSEWSREVDQAGKTISLYQFALDMIYTDRRYLKEIAGLVLDLQREKENRREIELRTTGKNNSDNNNR